MKKILIISISWTLAVLSMVLIFAFSSENSDKSSQTSSQVVEDVLKIPLPDEQVTPQLVKKFDMPMRKVAHFSIFAMLGFFIVNALNVTFKKRYLLMCGIAMIFSVLYAISDELHQKFVDGRVMSFWDVIIDSIGAVFGILFYSLIMFIIVKIKAKNNKIIN